METFSDTILQLTQRYSALWLETSGSIPAHLRRFSRSQKAEKEHEVDLLLEKSVPQMERFRDMEESDRAHYLGKAHTALGKLLIRDPDPSVDVFFEECETAGKEFVRRARQFDTSLRDEEIHQALRNQWVFNSIQSYLGHPVTLTPSSLGYSLMYPYTDNWLDGDAHTAAEKEAYNQRLKRCLEGLPDPDDADAPAVFPALVRMIEEEYPRGRFPAVYDSLFAILRGQSGSLLLHGPVDGFDEPFLQSLTIEKGGASVAVDGVLVRGSLGADALHALFGYGVVLQFIDDFQDIAEDTPSGHSSMFTRACRDHPLDEIAGRLLSFTCDTVRLLERPGQVGGRALSGLIEGSCVFLILEAAARYRHLFTAPYLETLEALSPLRFTYLAGLHDRVRSTAAGREHVLFPA